MSDFSSDLMASIYELVEETVAECKKVMPKDEYMAELAKLRREMDSRSEMESKTMSALQKTNRDLYNRMTLAENKLKALNIKVPPEFNGYHY